MRDFHYTVNVLVKAYMNNTLQHWKCQACAVGNIVAEATGFIMTPDNIMENEWDWWGVVKPRFCVSDQRRDRGIKQIEATGYCIEEIARIEFAFERSDRGASEEEWNFNGLMAVVDVLAEIHGIDLTAKEEAKKLFVKELS
jgi:hypothetical protein